ncbi:MAG: aminotransferase class III-fold pyridoxal phosphate-dependent enzyme [Bacteroidota bacterium]
MEADYSAPGITEEQAAHIAGSLYGLKGEILQLPGEVDFNFKIADNKGSFILKVSRPDEDVNYLLYQQELLKYLAEQNPELEAPLPVPDLQGNMLGEITDEAGFARKVRLLSWVDGRLWSKVNPIINSLLYSLGEKCGMLTVALAGFNHPGAHRNFDWDLAQAGWTTECTGLFSLEQQNLVAYFQIRYNAFREEYQLLRKCVVHNDANDNNILVSENLPDPDVRAVIDFGDAIYTQVINDLAIAIAYAVMGKPDVLSAALPVVKGYHKHYPILEEELEYLYCLVAMRLVISVTKSALNRKAEPDNSYLLISEKPAWDVLKKWKAVREEHALYSFRHACEFTPYPGESGFKDWAQKQQITLSSLFPDLNKELVRPLDLSVSSLWVGHQSELDDLEHFQYKLTKLQAEDPGRIIAGGYLETRAVYTTPAYDKPGNMGRESRTVHLGIDLWVPAGTAVHALFDGEVHTAVNDKGDKEYGGLIILRHRTGETEFFTLHGHLAPDSLEDMTPGKHIKQGECIGTTGTFPENGNWVPHLHFQIMLSMLGYENDFPGVAYYRELEVWKSICPDPNLLFKNRDLKSHQVQDLNEVLRTRRDHLGKSLSLSYKQPLKMVRGMGAYLIDHTGRWYLDTVNNVAHVGHEHPDVVKAGQEQMAVLNTNTRYLHNNINEFAMALLETFPDELSMVHFVNSGSEANELALRMAHACTGEKDMIAVEVGYHGNTTGCVDVSSYKFDGKGGKGAPLHTHVVPLPDSYRGMYRGAQTGASYAGHIKEQIDRIKSLGRNVAGFICESIISCGGQIELPEGYLKKAYESVRKAGGICIADEVQTGCGRVGSAFWGFQLHGVLPDIVTIGKPIGNGHPLAAVVCTPRVAESFDNGMEYFNTFGGNPVSCAIGKEVLSVIKREQLQENALETGNYLKSELVKMQSDFPEIGDVRGQGLFLGMELCDHLMNPLTQKTAYLADRMKELGILMSTDGKDENVMKIKPPLVFSKENADTLLSALKRVFKEDFMNS